MPRKKSPPGHVARSPEVSVVSIPPTVRREVAARVVLGVSPSAFDSLRQRADFPQGMAYGPQCIVWDTAELLAWRDRHRGLTVADVPPITPPAVRRDWRKVEPKALATSAKELHAKTYGRKGPARKQVAA